MEAFTGASVPIEEIMADCEAARRGREGFYHGVAVRYRNDWFVLVGPPAAFEPGRVVQPGLFGEPSR